MDISPFYELRTRLYSSAAAGCRTVNEDFRLKRAVDSFEPLSAANRVFGKIFAMCQTIFTSDNPSKVLAECIALADAAAVTLGGYGDDSDTAPSFGCVNSQGEHTHSEIASLCSLIERRNIALESPSQEQLNLSCDCRVLSVFLRTLDKGNSLIFKEMISFINQRYGKNLVRLLKSSVDTADPKAAGNCVELVSRLAGDEENVWYEELALNVNAPVRLRAAAIHAMALSDENTAEIMYIYNTEKGIVKNAALEALAGIDCMETEELFRKLLKNYKPSLDSVITLSRGKVCTDFVTDMLESDSGSLKKTSEKYARLLSGKPFADKGFLILAKRENCSEIITSVLINNLRHKDKKPFIGLINRLYNEDSRYFFLPQLFALLIEDPDKASEFLKSGTAENAVAFYDSAESVYYNESSGKYCLDWRVGCGFDNIRGIELGDNFIEFINDSVIDSDSLKKDEQRRVNIIRLSHFSRLLKTCPTCHRKKIADAAEDFINRQKDNCPSYLINDLYNIINNNLPKEQ